MKIVRYLEESGEVKAGVMDDAGRIRALPSAFHDLAARPASDADLDSLRALVLSDLATSEPHRLLAPVGGVGKIIGVGLNYRDHALECGLPLPPEPTLFLKATSALCGPDDALIMPRDAARVDWEVELAAVIGKPGAYISESAASDHVLGYCLAVDFSERDFQFNRGGQGFKGKSADTFGPLGPWLVTRDDIPDPHALALWLDVNGTRQQSGNTRDMIFSVPELVSYVSRFMSLQPGDVILTGTPAGVGMGRTPQVFLAAGDEVMAGGDGLGRQRHCVRA